MQMNEDEMVYTLSMLSIFLKQHRLNNNAFKAATTLGDKIASHLTATFINQTRKNEWELTKRHSLTNITNWITGETT